MRKLIMWNLMTLEARRLQGEVFVELLYEVPLARRDNNPESEKVNLCT
jgi:hypothetical protein